MMIVLAQNFVLSPSDNPLNTPIFLWQSLVTAANVSATSAADGFPALNLANPSTNLRWVAAGDGSPPGPPAETQYLTVEFSDPTEVDALAIAVHNLGTGQNIVSVEGADGGSPSWFELVQESIQANDDPLLFRFTPQSLTGLRLKIQPGSEIPFVAVMYVGKLLVMERGTHADHVPINLSGSAETMNARSTNGQFLGSVVLSEERSTSIPFQRIRPSWYRERMAPFIAAAKRQTPFFFAWKPQEFPKDVGYCWMTNDPQPSVHFDTGTFDISLNMGGVAV